MIQLHICEIYSECWSFLEECRAWWREKWTVFLTCLVSIYYVLCFSGVPPGHDSQNPAAGGRGWIFFPTRQKVFLRLRLGGWMTRNVIGDFREWGWFYFFFFFSLESWFSVGTGGRCIPTLFDAATDGPRKDQSPFGFTFTMERVNYFIMRLDARRSFAACCYLSLISPTFAMLRNHNVQSSKKANGDPFNNFSDLPNWTRAFHHILFSTLQPKKKKTEKKPFCALSQTTFSFRPPYSVPLSQLP